ncbi:hypothetical protein [Haloarchaeobius sp. FL176]|uniref:AbrB/MazE/SpoVT family DNA-binding domain-containing protein n=1 Tax=Haloarchaeobius sp. FL176 TaxID=2967129 RepID=UPI002147ADCC|nr:hypothetical protein [Haloarchaeobius sp. FL176]
MVQLHKVSGNAKTSYGVYVNKALIDLAGWEDGDSLRITVIDHDLILVTRESMPTEQWIELYDAGTTGKTMDELTPVELVRLLDVGEGEDGRRPSTVSSLAPLGGSGHRILLTNAAKRLQLHAGTGIRRRANEGVVVLIPTPTATDEVNKRAKDVLDARGAQISG